MILFLVDGNFGQGFYRLVSFVRVRHRQPAATFLCVHCTSIVYQTNKVTKSHFTYFFQVRIGKKTAKTSERTASSTTAAASSLGTSKNGHAKTKYQTKTRSVLCHQKESKKAHQAKGQVVQRCTTVWRAKLLHFLKDVSVMEWNFVTRVIMNVSDKKRFMFCRWRQINTY